MTFNQNLLYEVIAKKIRSLRESKGVTQDSLAKLLDISRPTLISYETGKQPIGIGDIYTLAVFFEIQVSDLLPSIEEITNLSKPEVSLEKDKHLLSGPKEEIKDFLDELRKG